uniref:peptidylprolyl isomerase n=3 Tax=Ixodes ricinus TaxID=34613 RepID=V5H8U7_IXORI
MRNRPHRSLLCDVMVLGLAKALMTMRKGERARVLVQPEYAFGKMGCAPRIPGNATILYEVELLHFVDAEDALELEGICVDGGPMPFPKLLELCAAKHKTGNSFCERKEFQNALKCYSSALHRLENARTKDAGEETKQQQLLLKLFCNASLCCVHTGRGSMAVAYAKKALLIDPNNVKALYRCGVGLKMQGCFDEAEGRLRRAHRLDPNSQAIIRELNELNSIKRQLRETETNMCRRMFNYANNDKAAEAMKALSLNSGVSEEMQAIIKESLRKLKGGTAGSSLPFTTGFTDSHYDYVRSVCQNLGLGCEDLPKGGVRAFVRDAE